MNPSRFAPLALLPLACACSSLEDTLDDLQRVESGPAQELAPPMEAGDALLTIARLEDARDDGDGLLQILAGMFTPEVRERAVLALGRLPSERFGAGVTDALVAALDDPLASVRATAAFSLGQRGDPAAAPGLLDHWLDPEPTVRAAIVAAAGRIDEPRLAQRVLQALHSRLEVVRIQAVLAPHRWSPDDPRAEQVDQALAEVAARPSPRDAKRLGLPVSAGESPAVIWRTLFSLQRRRAQAGRGVYHAHVDDREPLARLFAVKGLARIEPHEGGRLALERALADRDWRVAVEAARGLGTYGDQGSLDALETALDHPSHHVRATVAEALGRFEVDPARVGSLLEALRADRSPSVRAAGIVGEAALRGARALPLLRERATDGDPLLRAAVAAAAAELPAEHALPLLLRLVEDDDPPTAQAAAASLGAHDRPAAHDALLALLERPDNGLRLAAVSALRTQPRCEDLGALRRTFASAHGDIGPELRVEAVRAAAALDTPDALEFLGQAAADGHPHVRAVAAAACRERGAVVPPFEGGELPAPAALPRSGTDRSSGGSNPRVEVLTSKGPMVFELLPAEAPVHVFNFLELARRDHYDGLTFQRVVADFVVQGGCYRGDGNGSGTWRGRSDALRHEFGPRAYARGSLGMPRNEDRESGGSQFFVTHRPTPHLDGLYTIFGELREGFEVLDALELGDSILDVRLL